MWSGLALHADAQFHTIALPDARPDAQRAAPWDLDRRQALFRERTGEHTPKASAAFSGKVTSLRSSIAATAIVGTTTTKTHNHGTRRGRNTRSDDGPSDRSGWLLLVSSGRLSVPCTPRPRDPADLRSYRIGRFDRDHRKPTR